jgi:hypothetical protein
LRKVVIDFPGSGGVRIGQGIARNCLAAKPHVVQPPSLPSTVPGRGVATRCMGVFGGVQIETRLKHQIPQANN